jgi:hypothetical protein
MRYKMANLIGMLCLLTAFDALAVDWSSVIKTQDTEVLVDMDSYSSAAGLPYISTQSKFKTEQTYYHQQTTWLYLRKTSRAQFNCAQHTVRNLAVTFYSASNQRLGREKENKTFEKVDPGSVNQQLESLVCQVYKMVGGQ